MGDTGQLGCAMKKHYKKTPVQIVASGVQSCAAGADFSLFVKEDGSLMGLGNNRHSELGAGSIQESFKSTHVPWCIIESGVVSVSAGDIHTLVVSDDHALWGFGANGNGQLGSEHIGECMTRPTKIISSGVQSCSAGSATSLFVTQSSQLWGMGANFAGQLGIGDMQTAGIPKQAASNVWRAFCGESSSMFIKEDGSLWGMGSNVSGKLGLESTAEQARRLDYRKKPVQIMADALYAACGEGVSFIVNKDSQLLSVGQLDYGGFHDGPAACLHPGGLSRCLHKHLLLGVRFRPTVDAAFQFRTVAHVKTPKRKVALVTDLSSPNPKKSKAATEHASKSTCQKAPVSEWTDYAAVGWKRLTSPSRPGQVPDRALPIPTCLVFLTQFFSLLISPLTVFICVGPL